MVKRRNISAIYFSLGILGEILILVGFLLLTPNGRGNVALLNWGVVSIIFGLNYFNSELLFPPTSGFSTRIPAIGIRLVICLFYTFLSIVWIFFGYRLNLAFKVQFLGHLGMVFIVLVVYVVARKSSDYAAQVEEIEVSLESILNSARYELKLLCSGFSKDDQQDSLGYRLLSLQEELRFLSPVNDDRARNVEEQILELIQQIREIMSGTFNVENSNGETLNRYIESLSLMIKQRKTYRM